jgi:hypothetical protein
MDFSPGFHPAGQTSSGFSWTYCKACNIAKRSCQLHILPHVPETTQGKENNKQPEWHSYAWLKQSPTIFIEACSGSWQDQVKQPKISLAFSGPLYLLTSTIMHFQFLRYNIQKMCNLNARNLASNHHSKCIIFKKKVLKLYITTHEMQIT